MLILIALFAITRNDNTYRQESDRKEKNKDRKSSLDYVLRISLSIVLCGLALFSLRLWRAEVLIAGELSSHGTVEKTAEEKWKIGTETGAVRILANSIYQRGLEGQPACHFALELAQDRRLRPDVVRLALSVCSQERDDDNLRKIIGMVRNLLDSHETTIATLSSVEVIGDDDLLSDVLHEMKSKWTYCKDLSGENSCSLADSVARRNRLDGVFLHL